MAGRSIRTLTADTPQTRRIRRTWWFLAGSFFVLGVVTLLRLLGGQAARLDWILGGLVLVAGLAAVLHREAVLALEASRRSEAESFARILQGLSRSVSPDAIVDAIVEELGVGTGADHIVVVRLRPDAGVLEATLVSQRPGVPSATTLLPPAELLGPWGDGREPGAATKGGDRAPVGIPIDSGPPSHEPTLIGVGAGAGGSSRRGSASAKPDRRSSPRRRSTAGRRSSDDRAATDRRRTWTALSVAASERATATAEPPTDDLATIVMAAPLSLTSNRPAAAIADRIASRVQEAYGLKHTIAAPLVAGSGVVGAIVLSRRTSEGWPVAARRILAGAAVEASAALERVYSHRAAEARAATDVLTGLPNRRYFDEFCGLLARRRRADDAIGVLMIDIDRFKRLNDARGHAAGDRVLRAVGQAIAATVREDDVPARFGGEEFAVLLRNPTKEVALEVGERVRRAVADLDVVALSVSSVSVSVGVAVSEDPHPPIGELVDRADRALYAAKRAGRNRVVVWPG